MFGPATGLSAVYANTGLDWLGDLFGSLPMTFFDIADPTTVAHAIEEASASASLGLPEAKRLAQSRL